MRLGWWDCRVWLSFPLVATSGCLFADLQFGNDRDPEDPGTTGEAGTTAAEPTGDTGNPAATTESTSPAETTDDGDASTGQPDPAATTTTGYGYACPELDSAARLPRVCVDLFGFYEDCYGYDFECIAYYLEYCQSYFTDVQEYYGVPCHDAVEAYYACIAATDCRDLDTPELCEAEHAEIDDACM